MTTQDNNASPPANLDVSFTAKAAKPDSKEKGEKGSQDSLASTSETKPRVGDEGRPYCPVHICIMVSNGTKGGKTYYKCPCPNCKETEKRAHPKLPYPKDPKPCPMARCQGVFMEASKRQTSSVHLRMKCPNCSFEVDTPRPQALLTAQTHGKGTRNTVPSSPMDELS